MPYNTHDPACPHGSVLLFATGASAALRRALPQHLRQTASHLPSHCIPHTACSCVGESMSEFNLVPMSSTCKVLRMVSFLSCRINSPTNFTMPEMAVAVSDDAASVAPTSVLSSFACTSTWLSSAACNKDDQNSDDSHICICHPCPQHTERKAHSAACTIGMSCKQLL